MADPAPGVVTFLFTDIEGSTRLWEEQTEAMHRDLARIMHEVPGRRTKCRQARSKKSGLRRTYW